MVEAVVETTPQSNHRKVKITGVVEEINEQVLLKIKQQWQLSQKSPECVIRNSSQIEKKGAIESESEKEVAIVRRRPVARPPRCVDYTIDNCNGKTVIFQLEVDMKSAGWAINFCTMNDVNMTNVYLHVNMRYNYKKDEAKLVVNNRMGVWGNQLLLIVSSFRDKMHNKFSVKVVFKDEYCAVEVNSNITIILPNTREVRLPTKLQAVFLKSDERCEFNYNVTVRPSFSCKETTAHVFEEMETLNKVLPVARENPIGSLENTLFIHGFPEMHDKENLHIFEGFLRELVSEQFVDKFYVHMQMFIGKPFCYMHLKPAKIASHEIKIREVIDFLWNKQIEQNDDLYFDITAHPAQYFIGQEDAALKNFQEETENKNENERNI